MRSIKTKLFSLAMAVSMVLALAGCAMSAPSTVGSIGGVEIPAGIYLLAQYNSYNTASGVAELATGETASDVKAVLKATCTGTINGEDVTAVGSDYVAQLTTRAIEYYAAVEKQFAEQNGVLDDTATAEAAKTADSLWSSNGDLYTANGISKSSVETYLLNAQKAKVLLKMTYGPDGTSPVTDAEYTDYVNNDCYYIEAVQFPLVNYSTYSMADDDQKAAIMATRSKRRFIMQADIDEAILKVVMGPEKKSRVVSERARRLTAYHESGHAIASFFLKNSDPVHYITIIPRGAAGGFTWYRKAEDAENFTSRGEMFDSIVSALGGRIAEQLFLDDISTGASNDIQQATNIARDMVMKYGMSEKLGPISFDDSSHSIFIGRDFGTTKSYSEETAATIDEEVKHLFDQAYAKCEALLREHADLLTGLAEYLLIHETIEGDDFRYYCEHGVMPVHPDDTIEPPAKVIRRMDEAPETPQPDAEAPAQPEAPSAPDADAPNSDPGEQP